MGKILKVLLGSSLLVILALSGCGGGGSEGSSGSEGGDDAKNDTYYPLAVGSKWTYSDASGTETSEVMSDGRIKNVHSSSSTTTTYGTFVVENDAIYKSESEYIGVGNSFKTIYTPPILMVPGNLTPGIVESSTSTTSVNNIPISLKSVVTVLEPETVTVPFGTFNCIKIKSVITGTSSGETTTNTSTSWLAKNVGVVKVEREITGNAKNYSDLTSFTENQTIPTCTAPEVLEDGICVNPTINCNEPEVLVDGVCVTPTIKCTAPEVLKDGICVNPTIICNAPEVLVNGLCVQDRRYITVVNSGDSTLTFSKNLRIYQGYVDYSYDPPSIIPYVEASTFYYDKSNVLVSPINWPSCAMLGFPPNVLPEDSMDAVSHITITKSYSSNGDYYFVKFSVQTGNGPVIDRSYGHIYLADTKGSCNLTAPSYGDNGSKMCSEIGLTMDSSAGVINFMNTKLSDNKIPSLFNNSVSGTLYFPPF